MLQDLRFALRTLRRRARGNAAVILILALGIGANAVVFTLVEAMLLRPLVFRDADELVRIYATQEVAGGDRLRVTEGAFFDWRRESRSFTALLASRNTGLSVTDAEQPLNPLMRLVSENFFQELGVEPLLGRLFAPDEHRDDARVAILAYGFWQSYFGGDPEIVGRTIELADEPWTIVGVMPAGYQNPVYPQGNEPVLWMPLVEPAEPERRRAMLVVVGRLAGGVGLTDATAELEDLSAELARRHPDTDAGRGVRVLGLRDSVVERFRPALYALFGAVGFVLLMACANVANLLLARAVDRREEIAVRLALGASRAQLLRQLLAESLVLGLCAAGLGLIFAFWAIEPLIVSMPDNLGLPRLDEARPGAPVMLFTALLAVVTSLVFGLAPMVQAWRARGAALAAGSRSGQEPGRRRLRTALVVAEVALSLVLLVGAGLMTRTFLELRGLDLGFEPEGLHVVRVSARGGIFDQPEGFVEFHRRVLTGLRDLPGVRDAGACEILPMFAAFRPSIPVRPHERREDAAGTLPRAVLLRAMPGFFRAFGTPILRGRAFTDDDRPDTEPVAVISARLARRLWGDQGAVGRELVLDAAGEHRVRIVGVAGDLRGLAQAPEPPPILYLPQAQDPAMILSYFLRGDAELDTLTAQTEQVVWQISRDAPVYDASTLREIVRNIEAIPRFTMQLLTGFALFALLLAASGLYAVLAYAVAERTREIGLRVAIGATRGDVVALVLRGAALPIAIGLGIGLLGAIGTSRLIESQLYAVTSTDIATYAAVALLLALVAFFASYLPALRATRVDPVEALRGE